jgi:predicted ATPase
MPSHSIPQIQSLHIQNYRVLKDLVLSDLTPLSVFIGPNGSGKSTLLEALAFLSNCFQIGLSETCKKYGGLSRIKTYRQVEPIQLRLTYFDPQRQCQMIYTLAIQEHDSSESLESDRKPYIESETLEWIDDSTQATQPLLAFFKGQGWAIPGEISLQRTTPHHERQDETFSSPDTIAANLLGQFAKYPYLQTLRQFLSSWYFADLSQLSTQSISSSNLADSLSSIGDNLTSVIESLEAYHPDYLRTIVQNLTRYIPQLRDIQTTSIQGKRRLLLIQDNPENTLLPAEQASSGTLLLLAYLLILQAPNPNRIILIDEPENYLHPRLMIDLGEKFRSASAQNQLFITTHSPYFVDTLRPQELWVLHREIDGFTQARRAADMRGINAFIDDGALLGQLWMENFFEVGDPLKHSRSA